PAGKNGKVESSKVYLKFSSDPNVRPIYEDRYLYGGYPSLINGPLFIPANTVQTFNERSAAMAYDKSLVGLAPHSHLICVSWEVFMVTPDGDTTNLLYIPQWDFGWQYSYQLTKVLKVPEGTKFYGQGVFDNTVNNPNNPSNPPIDVDAGQSTLDEMMACRFWIMDYQPGDENIILDSAFYGLTNSTTPIPASLALHVFPNPSSGLISVECTGHENDHIQFIVFDGR